MTALSSREQVGFPSVIEEVKFVLMRLRGKARYGSAL